MKQVIVEASTEAEAKEVCQDEYGWTPDAVREVDSGQDGVTAYMCFENARDAETWDRQT